MSVLIRHAQVALDDYVALPDGEVGPTSARRVIVPLERWQSERALLLARFDAVGVRLPNTADLAIIWPQIADRPLLELDFPAFADGRAYSQARLLRERYRFAGEIRAQGQAVVRDHMLSMSRVGVTSFRLRADQLPEVCIAGLADFDLAYQRGIDDLPVVQTLRRKASA